MAELILPEGKNLYFASDFHLGVPTWEASRKREDKIVRWLEFIRPTAGHIFLMGDLFDFWFEYSCVIPKGFIRFQGKLAELSDSGIPITIFTGNHDIWMFGYFTKELGITVEHQPKSFEVRSKKIHIGHGDGLGPGDYSYKILKKIFENKLGQFLFEKVHPTLGIRLANFWSKESRKKNYTKKTPTFLGDDEWIWQYCKDTHAQQPHHFYIFGHRHLPLDLPVGTNGRYINLGEWLSFYTYAQFDGQDITLQTFKNDKTESWK